ncbi:hypothetical protein LINPERHAP1_LOCUS17132, partial [Linum perenne]
LRLHLSHPPSPIFFSISKLSFSIQSSPPRRSSTSPPLRLFRLYFGRQRFFSAAAAGVEDFDLDLTGDGSSEEDGGGDSGLEGFPIWIGRRPISGFKVEDERKQ